MPTVRVCPKCRETSYGAPTRCGSCGYLFKRPGLTTPQIVAILTLLAAVVGLGIFLISDPGSSEPVDSGAGVAPQAPDAPAPSRPSTPSTPSTPSGGTPELKTVIQQAGPAVVRIDVRLGTGGAIGSGFVSDERGHVLTNHHVISGARSITVTDAQGRKFEGRVVASDASVDLALLQVAGLAGTPSLKLSSSGHLEQGDRVVALGSPEGLTNSVSEGIVSAVDRTIQLEGGATLRDALQTTAPISHGSSGGPLVELRTGAVIGITTAGSETGQNLGFAVSGDTILSTLKRWGK